MSHLSPSSIPSFSTQCEAHVDKIARLVSLANDMGIDVKFTRSLGQEHVSSVNDTHQSRCLNAAQTLRNISDMDNENDLLEWYYERVRKSRLLLSTLSLRERQVAVLVGHGYANKEVASAIGVSEKTIEKYRGDACRKLRLPTAAEVAHLLAAAHLFVGYKTDKIAGMD